MDSIEQTDPEQQWPEIATEISAFESGITRLYHYEPFKPEYLISMFRDLRVHCSDPSRLNDPWDCQPAFDTSFLNDAVQAKRAIDQLQSLVPAAPIDPYKDTVMELEMRLLPSGPVKALNAITSFFGPFTRERWRIYCLTPHPDSTLMWSHYADNHRGICLEFACDNNPTFAYAMKVIYRATYPTWRLHKMEKQATEILLTKSDEWSYEEEYRVIARTKDTTPGQPSAFGVAEGDFIPIPPQSLVSVIAGSRADYRLIKTIVAEYFPALPVKRAVRVPNLYRVKIQPPSDTLHPRLFSDLQYI